MSKSARRVRQQRSVVITGGRAKGIAAATAHRFLREGYKVALVERDRQLLEECVESLGGKDDDLMPVVADVSVPEQVEHVMDEVKANFGSLDVLVNNAASAHVRARDDVDHLPADQFMELIKANALTALLMTQAAIQCFMNERGGAIVLLSTLNALPGGARYGQIGYTMAKASLFGLMLGLIAEKAPQRIRVNIVAPGTVFTDSDHWRRRLAAERDFATQEARSKLTGRLATTEDVADAIYFTATNPSINGVTLAVDGGESVGGIWLPGFSECEDPRQRQVKIMRFLSLIEEPEVRAVIEKLLNGKHAKADWSDALELVR